MGGGGGVNVLGLASLPSAITGTLAGDGDPWKLSFSVLSISIGGMALYLAHRVFPKFREERDPLGIAPPRYVFPEETLAP